MKDILIVSTVPFNVNGITMVVSSYYDNFKTIKDRIDFAIPREINSNYNEKLSKYGSKIFVLPDRKKNLVKYLMYFSKLIDNYDSVFVNGNSVTMLFETFIAKIKHKKVITITHNSHTDHPIFNEFFKIIFNKTVDIKLAVSHDSGKNVYNSKFITIENGVDVKKYRFNAKKRHEIRKKFNFTYDDTVLVCVGRINEVKNQKFLVNVMNYLNSNYKLMIIGDGSDRKKLEYEFDIYGKNKDRVFFTGNVDNVSDYLSASDIFLTPSLYEGFSLVVVESQCNGLPGIISRGNTSKTKIMPNVSIISIDDEKSWIEKIKTIKKVNIQNRIQASNIIEKKGYGINTKASIIENLLK